MKYYCTLGAGGISSPFRFTGLTCAAYVQSLAGILAKLSSQPLWVRYRQYAAKFLLGLIIKLLLERIDSGQPISEQEHIRLCLTTKYPEKIAKILRISVATLMTCVEHWFAPPKE